MLLMSTSQSMSKAAAQSFKPSNNLINSAMPAVSGLTSSDWGIELTAPSILQVFSRFAVEQGEYFEIAIRMFWCHHTAVRRLWGMGDDT
jgi:hypothetical protein